MSIASSYSAREEWAHTFTHGVGALLAIAALVLLVVFATGAAAITSAAVFGATLVMTYSVSTLYHAVPAERVDTKRALQRLDHCCIYLLIAGSYTPFALVTLPGAWGWTLFFVVWGLAVLGVLLKHTPLGDNGWVSNASYLGMGWLAVVAFEPLVASLPVGGLALLVAGGLAYTFGVVFFVWERLPYHHVIWHLFVLAGSTLHVLAVLLYVV
ncbi:MAG: hemolysin III family protein [Myxococcales bacterium]|nr:hemolysin III family protein [Myxococcales bacterium]